MHTVYIIDCIPFQKRGLLLISTEVHLFNSILPWMSRLPSLFHAADRKSK